MSSGGGKQASPARQAAVGPSPTGCADASTAPSVPSGMSPQPQLSGTEFVPQVYAVMAAGQTLTLRTHRMQRDQIPRTPCAGALFACWEVEFAAGASEMRTLTQPEQI